ncbi:MAG: lysoplasmalogenase [Spirochaetaceae bacterium]|jgi:uncharacterized membrane protein YhhN|nr:lysoplasmalogenase [Spirochaetaceae bacterium]
MDLSFYLIYIYVLVCLVNVLGEFLRFNLPIRYITTPMVMPLLAWWFILQGGFQWPMFVILGLFWIGDIIHMLGDDTDRKTLGVVLFLFLIGHLMFIRYFWMNIVTLRFIPATIWAVAFVLALITLALVFFMRKSLRELALPVIIYALALITMGIVVLLNINSMSPEAFYRALAGVLLFIISGTFIGYHQIVKNYGWSRQVLMGTYFPAVFFLVQAVILLD